MKRGGNGKQAFAHEVEKEPKQQHAEKALGKKDKAHEAAALSERRRGEFQKTSGADKAVIVLSDTLATKEMPALKAAARSFALGMVEAALVAQR